MSLITPNLDEIQEAIEAGEYKVRVTKVETDVWAANEKRGELPYLKVTLDTFDEEEPKNNGRKIFYNMPIAGKGAFLVSNFYAAATGEKISKDAPSFDTEQIMGCELTMIVDINDAGYTEVKSVRSIN